MKKNHINSNVISIILFSSLILTFIGIFLFNISIHHSGVTGNVIAPIGGTINEMNITNNIKTTNWYGSSGNISPSGIKNYNFSLENIVEFNIFSNDVTNNNTYIIATLEDDFNFTSITTINPNNIDDAMGINHMHPQSATNTFTNTINITAASEQISLNTAFLKSTTGRYFTSPIKSNGKIGFITKFVDAIGYKGNNVQYQMMLPKLTKSTNYKFYVVQSSQINPPITNGACSSDIILRAKIINDNTSVQITWDNVPGFTEYQLYYSDGLDENNQFNFSESKKVSGLTTESYIDTNSTQVRYYKVKSIVGGSECISNSTAVSYRIPLSPSSNLISLPMNLENNTVIDFIRPIKNDVLRINVYNNIEMKFYTFEEFMGMVFDNIGTIERGSAYWFTVNRNTTLPMAGTVNTTITIPIYNRQTLIGPPNIFGNNTVEYIMDSIYGNFTSIDEYNNDEKKYFAYAYFMGMIFGDVKNITPTNGYWISSTENGILTIGE